METLTKQKLVDWLVDFHNNCGYTDYFGYKMEISEFEKQMLKFKKWELQETVFDTSDEGQKFIESFKKLMK